MSLKDTTIRPYVFGYTIPANSAATVELDPATKTVKTKVTPEQYQAYEDYIYHMAEISRLVYSDAGVIYKVLKAAKDGEGLPPDYKEEDKTINNFITFFDKFYGSKRREKTNIPDKSVDGRPLVSYSEPTSEGKGDTWGRYIGTPSDVCCLSLVGAALDISPIRNQDLLMCFKGSSTVQNFKHDLYSQVKIPGNMYDFFSKVSGIPKEKIQADHKAKGYPDKLPVPSAFIEPMLNSWEVLTKVIDDFVTKPGSDLYLTGHSLGGAFTTFFGYLIAFAKQSGKFPNLRKIHITSFGAPTLLGDSTRMHFNSMLENGLITFDRVVSSYNVAVDIIPSVPVGFSHPGFRPLKTEIKPEANGRPYHLETTGRKIFVGGGVLDAFKGKYSKQYAEATIVHMPNLTMVPANKIAFAHAEYLKNTWLNAFRLLGMLNPGFISKAGKPLAYVAEIKSDGLDWKFVEVPGDGKAPKNLEPTTNQTIADAEEKVQGGRRRLTKRRKVSKRKTRKH